MKISQPLRPLATLIVAVLLAFPALQAQTIVGSGSSSSFVVFEAEEFGAPVIYEFRYDHDAANSFNTYDMLAAIDLADDTISFVFENYGSPASPNYFLDSLTYHSITLTNTNTPDGFEPFWYQSVAGGQSGYPSAAPIEEGIWTEGSGISSPFRIIEPGSWDGFVYGDYGDEPLTAPIPEPGAVLLFVLGAGALACYRWRRNA